MSFHLVEIRQSGRVVYASTVLHPAIGAAEVRQPGCSDPARALWIRSTSGGSLGDSVTSVFLTDLGSQEDGSADSAPLPPSELVFLPHAVLSNGLFIKANPNDQFPSLWQVTDLSYSYWLTNGAQRPLPTLEGWPGPGGIVWRDPSPTDGPSAERLASVLARVRTLASADAPSTGSGLDSSGLDSSGLDSSGLDFPGLDSRINESLGIVLGAFLDLVYAGRARDAWPFLRAAWDDGLDTLLPSPSVADMPRSREALEGAILEQMTRSPFIDELRRRNQGSIAP